MIKASERSQSSYFSLKQKKKRDKVFSITQQNKWQCFYQAATDVWILWQCLDHRAFSSWLFPSFLTIMLNKGAELSCMMDIICLGLVNLTSFSALSSSRVVFCLYLVHPWMGRSLAALPAGAPYAWDIPVIPRPTTWHSIHISYFPCSALLTVSLSGTLRVCQPAVSGVGGHKAAASTAATEYVPSNAHVCFG